MPTWGTKETSKISGRTALAALEGVSPHGTEGGQARKRACHVPVLGHQGPARYSRSTGKTGISPGLLTRVPEGRTPCKQGRKDSPKPAHQPQGQSSRCKDYKTTQF